MRLPSAGNVACATVRSIAPLTTTSYTFAITLVLDDKSGIYAFAADTYAATPLVIVIDAT